MKAQTVKFEGGKVSFVRQAFTPELEAELLSVPNSRHDDLVDSDLPGVGLRPQGIDLQLGCDNKSEFSGFCRRTGVR